MVQHRKGVQRAQREVPTTLGKVVIIDWDWMEPIDIISGPDPRCYSLLTKLLQNPDGGRACFPERWNSNRFEPLGRTFLVPTSQSIHFKCNCQKSSVLACIFNADAIERWFDGELEWTDARLKQSLDIASPAISKSLSRLNNELRTPNFATETLIELIFAEIVIELARYYTTNENYSHPDTLAAWQVRRIDERLAELGSWPLLSELAELCNLSPGQLSRLFRKSTGLSLETHLVRQRISHAKQLLRTRQDMAMIAHTLGCRSVSQLNAAFVEATGESLNAYRRRILKESH